ncbi:MAG TPA: NAD(P)/FAD-dependent oxidoreductase [Deltaproteobacteria bacterium]|nr:NAD(P)/FAD-dependent oxidoreductase [Deltaproteobacteria bacterium]
MVDRIGVVGASLAGLRTVQALRREGHAGRIIVVGDEPEPPYDRPPLSKQFLVEDWEEERLRFAHAAEADPATEWRLGQPVTSLETGPLGLELEDGSRLRDLDAVVIATGARARRLPFGRGLEGIHTLRSLADARALRVDLASSRRVVVVGAGFIGMEIAASCRQKGLEVTVVDPLPAPLVRGLGPILGERVAKRHREAGVAFHLGVGVEDFEGDARVVGVRLADGTNLPADLVVVGIGAVPATDWLATNGIEGARIEIDNGIRCDATGFTGCAGIFALGDCARWDHPRDPANPRFEHWTNAVEQADVVAQRIVKGEAPDFAPVPYVWTDQFELRIAIVGEVREGDEMRVGLGSLEDDRFLALFGREGRLTGAVGFKRPRQLNACRKRIAEGMGFGEAVEALL